MRFTLFCHSLVSDWNHGNAHFLRGVVRELQNRGHEVDVLEPDDSWSRTNLRKHGGDAAEAAFADVFPDLSSRSYDVADLDAVAAVDGADVVIVHEWTDPRVVAAVGEARRKRSDIRLLFHDTHHRAATAPEDMAALDLSAYDGVLAFGEVIKRLYLQNSWARRAWTWHEACDTTVFQPLDPPPDAERADLVWIGNWGDDERSAELSEFLLEPAAALGLDGHVYGVRYPQSAEAAVARSGLSYEGWVANHRVPEVFARHRVTVHVPRRPYVRALPGVPTIRMFEALGCGIPLVAAPWDDAEGLFRPGQDYLIARDGDEMQRHLKDLVADPDRAAEVATAGLETVRSRHTCAHRVDELLAILEEV